MHGAQARITRRLPVEVGAIAVGPVRLDAATHHYAVNVLRLPAGTFLEVFDGHGVSGRGQLQGVVVEVTETTHHEPISPTITLYQAIPKGDRWEWLIEKATELGADSIVPVICRWGVVDVPNEKMDAKIERWTRVATAASRQSERYFTPTIHRPVSLTKAVEQRVQGRHFLGQPFCDLPSVKTPAPEIGIWIGPEAGFAPEELQLMDDFEKVSFGPHVLRSETAGAFGVGLVSALLRDRR